MKQVIDIKKLKTDKEISDTNDHNLRITVSNNVNTSKTKQNTYYIGSSGMNCEAKINSLLATVPKFRKDAVKVVNLVFSGSPEFFQNREKSDQWEKETQKFVEETFGKDNIIYSVVHKDEKTPHFHISIVPIVNGKLNASHYFDGREKLRIFHDNYNRRVKKLGLQRGVEKQKPTPQALEDYYKKVNASTEYEQKLDSKIDRLFTKLDTPTVLDKLNPWGLINEVKPLLKTLGKSLSHYRTKSQETNIIKKELNKANKKLEDLELKFDNLGLKQTITFEDCKKLQPIIKIAKATSPSFQTDERLASSKPVLIDDNKALPGSTIGKFKPR